MDREIKLTLTNDGEEKNVENVLVLDENEVKGTEIKLTEEEQRQVDEFSKQIDIRNSKVVIEYGQGAQRKIASFSEKTLENVKTKDLGDIGELLSGVVNELSNFEIEENENKIVGFFKKSTNNLKNMQTKYKSTEKNIENIVKTLENHQLTLMKDIATFDNMYELNTSYYKELSMYILAGRKKLEEARNVELPQLQSKAQDTNLPIDAQNANDYINQINRFEKRLHDLDLTRMVSIQMAPQIRMVQSSNTVMVEKIQSIIVNTIPLWKSQMVIALGANHSNQAAKTTQEVTELTNKLLRKNAESLRQATTETARLSEKGIVDIETIKYTNEQLINSLNEVRDIQIKGHQNRINASEELRKIEENLKSSLREIADKN